MNKRVYLGIMMGAILGVFCIIGAITRYQEEPTIIYLFSFWYNRVIIGAMIGLLPTLKNLKYTLVRGFIVGLLISLAFYSATEFYDLMGFMAGGFYGVIIDTVLYYKKTEDIL